MAPRCPKPRPCARPSPSRVEALYAPGPTAPSGAFSAPGRWTQPWPNRFRRAIRRRERDRLIGRRRNIHTALAVQRKQGDQRFLTQRYPASYGINVVVDVANTHLHTPPPAYGTRGARRRLGSTVAPIGFQAGADKIIVGVARRTHRLFRLWTAREPLNLTTERCDQAPLAENRGRMECRRISTR